MGSLGELVHRIGESVFGCPMEPFESPFICAIVNITLENNLVTSNCCLAVPYINYKIMVNHNVITDFMAV